MNNIRDTFKEQYPVHTEPQVVTEGEGDNNPTVSGEFGYVDEWISGDRYGKELRTFPFA